MKNSPVGFNLPERTIEMISDYCAKNSLRTAEFVSNAMTEYKEDPSKLVDAVSKRINKAISEAGQGLEEESTKRTAYRFNPETCYWLRDVAKRTTLPFDGLARIILDDKLTRLEQKP